MRREILDEMKKRLGLGMQEHDERFLSYIDEVLIRITSYCNVPELPPELFLTAVSMSADLIRIELANLPEVRETITIGGGTKIKLGDSEISYGTGTTRNANIGNTAKSAIDLVCVNYVHDLNRVRKLAVAK